MGDEDIRRLERELSRSDLDPAQVARGLLGGRIYLVQCFGDFDVRCDAPRVFTSEGKARWCLRWLVDNEQVWGDGVMVEEHEIDFSGVVDHPNDPGAKVMPASVRRKIVTWHRHRGLEEHGNDDAPEGWLVRDPVVTAARRVQRHKCRACGMPSAHEKDALCPTCEALVERDVGPD